MNKQQIKKILLDNFEYLQTLNVKEYTLYRKWVDIKQRFPISNDIDDFFDSDNNYPELQMIKDDIFLDTYLNIKPKLIFVKGKENIFKWNSLRHMCHSAVWHASPGRLLKYYVIDEITNKYLGFISLGSDFISVGGRDDYIGWTTEDKLKGGRLRHTAMGSSIAAVQPFGFNYNGGKLIALLTASDIIQNKWKELYNEDLVGVTTTSLYGGASMYNRLKYWRKCKSTTGKISLEPSEDVYDTIRNWYKVEFPQQYKDAISNSHPKTKVLGLIYKQLNIKPPINNAPRGVYWNELYDNTKDFLCKKTNILGDKKYDNSVNALTKMWKERYAKKRIKNIIKDNRFSTQILFYDDMITDEWKDIKQRYL
jgi:hypothetical protein